MLAGLALSFISARRYLANAVTRRACYIYPCLAGTKLMSILPPSSSFDMWLILLPHCLPSSFQPCIRVSTNKISHLPPVRYNDYLLELGDRELLHGAPIDEETELSLEQRLVVSVLRESGRYAVDYVVYISLRL